MSGEWHPWARRIQLGDEKYSGSDGISRGGMLFYKSPRNNSLTGQKVAIGSITDLSTNKKFISSLPKYPTGPRSTVGLNFQKIKIK